MPGLRRGSAELPAIRKLHILHIVLFDFIPNLLDRIHKIPPFSYPWFELSFAFGLSPESNAMIARFAGSQYVTSHKTATNYLCNPSITACAGCRIAAPYRTDAQHSLTRRRMPRLFRPARGGIDEIHDVFLCFPPPSAEENKAD